MNKRFIYFLTGALLCGLVLVVFQMTRAAGVAPNPGHALSCHTVSAAGTNGSADATVQCDSGTCTGGGCKMQSATNYVYHSAPLDNGWECHGNTRSDTSWRAYAVCCEAI